MKKRHENRYDAQSSTTVSTGVRNSRSKNFCSVLDIRIEMPPEQIIIMGAGAHRLSARDLRTEIEHTNGQIRENYLEKEQKTKSYLLENASGELGDFLKELEEERKKESKKSKGKA